MVNCEQDKMAAKSSRTPQIKTSWNLGYVTDIVKIPEQIRVENTNYYLLSCLNDYSLMGLYDNFFDILSAMLDKSDKTDFCNNVLKHIKMNRKYYTEVSKQYLGCKKLTLVDWLLSMMFKDLPADELCLHASSTILNVHIIVDYLKGLWTTLDIPNICHNLTAALSDIHLVYKGACKYGLLCKKLN